uniref:Hook microtubule tethering protein 2 n=1 Tax=Scleropages formosus TaxID=113540 RepID=A0A8C9TMQ3_SCLFO
MGQAVSDCVCVCCAVLLQTFQVPSCTSKQDLTSGVAIAHVLHRIDPSWFNETWLGRIKEESSTNWRLKVSNLKKILQSVLEYYHDVLGHPISDEHLPDVSLIGEMGDVSELGKLVQLVLGCAVSCERKQEHIQQIMTLEESVQHLVMSISHILLSVSKSSSCFLSLAPSPSVFFSSSSLLNGTQLCFFLSSPRQLSAAQEEKAALETEARSLRERLSRSDTPDAVAGKKLLLLQSQLEQLQEENFRLESSRDDLRLRGDLLERELSELQRRNEELSSLAQEAQSLKDEMDVLRHSSDRVGRLEALVETYKRKLEDLGHLRRQVRQLEERNTVYMQRTCELEEELRRANTVRSQLDVCQVQVQELHTKHSAESLKAEKWKFEYKNLHDKYEAMLKEKERLLAERDTLRETNEELRCAQVQQTCLSQAGKMGNLASEIMPTEFKETLVRLQNENSMLCAQEESYRRQLLELQAQLEASQRSRTAAETQNRLNQQQISELRTQLEDLQRALEEKNSKAEDASLLKKKLEQHLEKLHEAHSDLQKKKEFIDDLEPRVDMSKRIDELQESLRMKDEDMKQMERRYKHYVEKARRAIDTLDPGQSSQPAPSETQSLKNQLTNKNRKIHSLEHDLEKARSRRDQEEKIIINAWYNMGMALHQKVAVDRSGSPGQAQSFLAQQRQSTYARRGLSSRLQARQEGEKLGKI